MITNQNDLTIELRSANGSSTEFYQANEEDVRETLRLLAVPRLFAQPHLLLTSQQCASIIPCKGIDMILARTSARTPLKFPLNLPVGQFDIVEQPEVWADSESAGMEDQDSQENGPPGRRISQVQIHTLGGWRVTLKAMAMIRGQVQDERQLFSHLPDVPTIPFRLGEGGFGLINTANIMRASAWPKPEVFPGIALPLELRRWTPSRIKSPANLAEASHS
ncbi:MAG TPA: hypothetical protein VL361_24930 [Candidatus Limnocylindrales bacterium]|jgi:hypothetical protein|nr:hypothetical protein [Candidatus Limnocylindrales bacterium]